MSADPREAMKALAYAQYHLAAGYPNSAAVYAEEAHVAIVEYIEALKAQPPASRQLGEQPEAKAA